MQKCPCFFGLPSFCRQEALYGLFSLLLQKPRLLAFFMWILHEAFSSGKLPSSKKNKPSNIPLRLSIPFNYPKLTSAASILFLDPSKKEGLKPFLMPRLSRLQREIDFFSLLLFCCCWYKSCLCSTGNSSSSSHVASAASLLPTLGFCCSFCAGNVPLSPSSFSFLRRREKAKNIFNNSDTFQPLLRQLFPTDI